MPKIHSLLATALATLIVVPPTSWGQTLQCKGDIAKVGDSKASVLQKCGRPAYEHSYCAPESTRQSWKSTHSGSGAGMATCDTVDEWTFNPGSGQFLTNLKFMGGKVVAITYGDRVK